MKTSELIVFTKKSVSYQGLEIDDASADSVLLIYSEPARPFIPADRDTFTF